MSPASSSQAVSEPVLYILLSLAEAPLHGYGIILRVEEWTGGRLTLRTGTLYTALRRLHEQGVIEEVAQADSEDDRRIHYRLTESGYALVRREAERVRRLATLAERVVG